jgi:GTP-binding protein
VIDSHRGPIATDHTIARELRRLSNPVMMLANKVDGPCDEAAIGPAYELGFLDVFPVSASHCRGIGEMLDALVARLLTPPLS